MSAELDAIVFGADLSDREIEVLTLAAEGLTNPKIGARLNLSPETVRSHLRRMSRKLGPGDRTGMVAVGYRRGILTVPPVDPGPMLAVPAAVVADALTVVSDAMKGRLRGEAHIRALRVVTELRAVLDALDRE